MSYITPRSYYASRLDRLRLIVIHTMEAPETDGRARSVAQWFAGPSAPEASAHVCIDNREVVFCLPPTATAWAAPGANADGYQIEHAGYAGQDATDWDDLYSRTMLKLSADHARAIARQYNIPLRHLTDAQLEAGEAGFVGHDQVSRVYHRSDHTDPGAAFPWDKYMTLVGGSSAAAKPGRLDEDALLGSDTITAWQWVNGTPIDGEISSQDEAWRGQYPEFTSGWDWVASEDAEGSTLIARVQTFFARLGFYHGEIDGLVGPQFVAAMIAYYAPGKTLAAAVEALQRALNRQIGA